jgi:hypothetical protein
LCPKKVMSASICCASQHFFAYSIIHNTNVL